MKLQNDSNSQQIVKALREAGATVHYWVPSARQKGQPDLVVGFRGVTWLLEIKAPKGELTQTQLDWHKNWTGGPIATVRTAAEALAAIGIQ